jgi:hypothetical protein
MPIPNSVADFIGEAKFDASSGFIFSHINGGLTPIAEIRGWGRIQNLFKEVPSLADKFQDELGEFITRAINNEIEKEKSL